MELFGYAETFRLIISLFQITQKRHAIGSSFLYVKNQQLRSGLILKYATDTSRLYCKI